MKNKYLLMIPAFLLASCTVGPDYRRPGVLTGQQIGESLELKDGTKRVIPQDWYKQFNDETLNYLIDCAIAGSPNVRVAVQKLREARTVLNIDAGQYLPVLDVGTKYDYAKPSKNIGMAIKTNYYQTGLDASWELDIWGAGRRLTEQNRALFEAAAANLDNVRVTLVSEVAGTYVKLRIAQEQLRIAEKNLRLQEDIFGIVAEKRRFGLTDDIAYNQAQYAVETTKSLIPQLEYQIEAGKNALAVLTGVLPGRLEVRLDPVRRNLVSGRFDFEIDTLFEIPAEIVRLRPDVRAAEQNLVARNAAIGQAVAELYPNVSISALFGYQSIRGTSLFTPASEAFSYTPAISLPVFHWGQLVNNVRLQKETAQEYVELYKNTLLNAVGEIKDAMVSVDKAYQKNKSDYQSVENMKKVMRYTLQKYRQGLIEFSDMLTAEQDLLKAQTELAAGNGAIYQSIIAYYKAVGGGYQSEFYEFSMRRRLSDHSAERSADGK